MWYVVQRYKSGYILLEGSGPNGGRWMVRQRGNREFFKSRAEAVEFIEIMLDFERIH